MVVPGGPAGVAPRMPRRAILAKSILLTRFSGLAARTAGVAPRRVLGHVTATCLIGGMAAAQLDGTDNAPIEEARPKRADNTVAVRPQPPRSAEPNDAD